MNMKLKTLAFGISLFLILASCLVYGYFFYHYYEIRELPVFLEVKKGVVGFNTNRDALNFGKLMPGSSGKRFVNVSFDKKSQLLITAEGEAAAWLLISPNNFLLESGQKKEITFTLEIPLNASEAEYQGKVKFYFKRP